MPRAPSDRMLPSWVRIGRAEGENVRGSPRRVFTYDSPVRARIDEKTEGGTEEGGQKPSIVYLAEDPHVQRNDEFDVMVSVEPGGAMFLGELAAAIGGLPTDTTLTVVSADGFPGPAPAGQIAPAFTIYLDNEQLSVTAGHGTTTWTVTRGTKNTARASHVAGTQVQLSQGKPQTCNGTAENVARMNSLYRVPCQGATSR